MQKKSGQKVLQGFTLVEVLVAMVILVLIIGAVTLIESKNINFSASSKYQTQANGVATEGLNVVKSISDLSKLGQSKCAAAPAVPVCDLTRQPKCCDNPTDSSVCPGGTYYLDSTFKLLRCTDQIDCAEGKVTIGTLPSIKEFTRKIIIPN